MFVDCFKCCMNESISSGCVRFIARLCHRLRLKSSENISLIGSLGREDTNCPCPCTWLEMRTSSKVAWHPLCKRKGPVPDSWFCLAVAQPGFHSGGGVRGLGAGPYRYYRPPFLLKFNKTWKHFPTYAASNLAMLKMGVFTSAASVARPAP